MNPSDTTILKAFLYAMTQCSEELPLSLTFGIHQVIKDWDNGDEKALVTLEELLYNYNEILPAYQEACVILKQKETGSSAPEVTDPNRSPSDSATAETVASPPIPSDLPSLKSVGFAILRAEDPQGAAKRKLQELGGREELSPVLFLELPET
ncbi:hypothetical protein [Roseofilum casamattae]|uniref:Uncharacterized protein n=1 Tax=Roseofilum casamattae BLCC-M143 TaxID=3022442 RepID=A0ABT7BZA5_9CYAN|nr:hypothetical protein [Roseofilum casamattae]MDJ1183608.1 hypothetical protein [Roseofilum casamattae BLCC-M143]